MRLECATTERDSGAARLFDDARRRDDDALLRPAGLGALRLDGLDDVHALDDLTEDDVLAVEPRGDYRGNEELEEHSTRLHLFYLRGTVRRT